MPAPGDGLTFDLLGERAMVMQGPGGTLPAFHDLCRNLGARVVHGAQGNCNGNGAVVRPHYAVVHDLDGSLRGVAQPRSFGALDRAEFGLRTIRMRVVHMRVFHGFMFLRFPSGPQPAVADLLALDAADFATHRAGARLPALAEGVAADLPVT